MARQGSHVKMELTVHAEDLYDFNPKDKDAASGRADKENGRFAVFGWAKPFYTHGSVSMTKSWTVDD